MSKFHNVASSASKDACFRAWVTDGSFKTEMDVPFQPPFSPGEELRISKAIPHFDGTLLHSVLQFPVPHYLLYNFIQTFGSQCFRSSVCIFSSTYDS